MRPGGDGRGPRAPGHLDHREVFGFCSKAVGRRRRCFSWEERGRIFPVFRDPSSRQAEENGRAEGQQETSGEVARETAGGSAEDGATLS